MAERLGRGAEQLRVPGLRGPHARPDDARARLVAASARGKDAIEAARRHRAALADEPAQGLGPRRVESARRLLLDLVAELGADTAVRGRQVRARDDAAT